MFRICAGEGPVIDLFHLTRAVQARGLQPPLLLRFPEIVAHRMQQLQVGPPGWPCV